MKRNGTARLPAIDSVAFSTIYSREIDYVWRSIRRLGIPERDLPDVVHDVFVTVWMILGSYDENRPFRPWLYGILFRVTSDHRRLSRTSRELLEIAPDVPDMTSLPDSTAAAREEWYIIDKALQRLDLRYRAALIMYDYEGHTAHEISRTLGIPIKTVFSRIYKARRCAQAVSKHKLAVGRPTGVERPAPRPLSAVDSESKETGRA